jgi:hypothetical protein
MFIVFGYLKKLALVSKVFFMVFSFFSESKSYSIYNTPISSSTMDPKNKLKCTLFKVLAFPNMIIPYLALVMVTFNLLGHLKNPIFPLSFDLTHETTI